jgi:hypothetical protein
MVAHTASFRSNVSDVPRDRIDLRARVVERARISSSMTEAMYGLYASHYSETSLPTFRRDLAGKTHVLLLTDATDRLSGFSTIQRDASSAPGYPVRTLFSGDTIIDPRHWGSSALAFEWMRFAGSVYREEPSVPLYWLLIVKGHRTYRFLPTFAHRYVPHHGGQLGDGQASLMNVLARARFGDAFDPATGIVRFPAPRARLNAELAEIPPHQLARPEVAYFVARNPCYRNGDELVCLCELAPANLKPRAARMFTANGAASPVP